MRRWANDGRLAAAALVFCALAAGCSSLCSNGSGIDPSGERVFARNRAPDAVRAWETPGGQLPWDAIEVQINPRATIAPVGSEVVLLGSVAGGDGYLRTNERVEWSIAPGSPGEFLDMNRSGVCDVLVGDFNRPRRLTNTFAVGSTSRHDLRLTRGTPTPDDDVLVRSGQTWISVTSPVEGTSYITAYSPDVYGWDRHKHTAIIHWIDAQWQFPPPAVNPAGSRRVLATSITRHSDQQPKPGWHVLYTIAGGPPAGFAPSGSQSIEVEADAQGLARAELVQLQPAAGTNTINIQVIRPGLPNDPALPRLVVGSGSTIATWSAPGLVLRKRGPAIASVGATLTYRIEVTNSGDQAADTVSIVDEIPQGLSYVNSTPAGQVGDRGVRWDIGRLSPGECRYVEINLRADRPGAVSNCAEVTASGGFRARECVNTQVSLTPPTAPTAPATPGPPAGQKAPLSVTVNGPPEVVVGSEVTFEIRIVNNTQTTIRGVEIWDESDRGLVHRQMGRSIKRTLGDLPPGQLQPVFVTFTATEPGRLCHTVEVAAAGGFRTKVESCVAAVAAGAPSRPAAGPVSIRITPPRDAVVGERASFLVEVTNTSQQRLTNVQLRHEFDHRFMKVEGSYEVQLAVDSENTAGWTVPQLEPNATQRYSAVFHCEAATPSACVTIRAIAQNQTLGEQQVCVPIRQSGAAGPTAPGGTQPSGGDLDVRLSTLTEPVRSGKELTYLIEVTNRGAAPQRDVRLTVTLPGQILGANLGTSGPTVEGATTPPARPDVRQQGQEVAFDALSELAPGQTARYRVRAQASRVPSSTVVPITARVLRLGLPTVTQQIQTTIVP